MREILFRGKTFEGKRWIYGDLRQWWYGHVGICDRETNWEIKVEIESVGQYTGLTDKNGTKIFEGDILQVDTVFGKDDRCVVGYGQFQPFNALQDIVGFYLYWKDDPKQRKKYANVAFWIEVQEATCIGNIHENPELMEVGHATD